MSGRSARTGTVAAIGMVLLLGGAATVAFSFRTVNPSPVRLGGNLPVNPGALNRDQLVSNNTPTVASNPTNPANLASVNRVDAPGFGCALNVSMDGGASWTPTRFPSAPGTNASCLAPDLAWSADGTLYISFTSYAEVPQAGIEPAGIYLVSSRDGGRRLSPPVRAEGTLAFEVRVLADPVVARRLYLTWVQVGATFAAGFVGTGNPIMLARSDDGAASWGRPVQVNGATRLRPLAPALAAGEGADLYLAYLDLQGDYLDYNGIHQGNGGEPYPRPWALVVARSRDGGATWSESVVEPKLVPTQRFVDLFAPTPSIAVDRAGGHLYVGFQDGQLGDADVYVWASSDGGVRWSAPTRVNDTSPHDGTSQYLPALQVAPNGRLDVVYYDRRSDPNDVLTGVSLQSSFDHAATFTPHISLTDAAFDSQIGFGEDRGLPELGSRLGLISTNHRVLAQWCDTRGGVRATRKQDIGQAIVAFPDPFPLRLPLRLSGIAASLAGLLVLTWAVRARPPQGVRAERLRGSPG